MRFEQCLNNTILSIPEIDVNVYHVLNCSLHTKSVYVIFFYIYYQLEKKCGMICKEQFCIVDEEMESGICVE